MRSDVPIYEQISQCVIEAIAKKEIEPEEELPSVRQLAADLGINMHTVAKAYSQLKDKKFISIHRNKGAVINPESAFIADDKYLDRLTEQLRTYALEAICRGVKGGEWVSICNDAFEGNTCKKEFLTMETGALIITFAICYIPIIVIFSILPYIGRRTLTFGVSIPSAVHDDERLKKLRGSFAGGVVILGAVLCGLSILPFLFLEENLAVGLMTALIFVYMAVIFLLYIRNFRQVKQLKEQEGWAQDAAMKAVADTKFTSSKRSVSSLWFLLYAVIIIGTLLAGILLYDQIPDEVAMQMDYSGNPTRIVQKSFGLILFAPAMQAVMALLMGFIYWMMQKTPPVIDSSSRKFRPPRTRSSVTAGQLLQCLWGLF